MQRTIDLDAILKKTRLSNPLDDAAKLRLRRREDLTAFAASRCAFGSGKVIYVKSGHYNVIANEDTG